MVSGSSAVMKLSAGCTKQVEALSHGYPQNINKRQDDCKTAGTELCSPDKSMYVRTNNQYLKAWSTHSPLCQLVWHHLVDNLVVTLLSMRVSSLPDLKKQGYMQQVILIYVPHHVVLVDRGIFSLAHAKKMTNFHTQ